MADTTQNISFNYKAMGLTEMRTQYMMLNQQLLQLNLNTERTNVLLAKSSASHKAASTSAGIHKNQMIGLALRFVGYNLILSQVMGAQQKLIQLIKESVSKFREFEHSIAEVSTIIVDMGTGAVPQLESGLVNLSKTFGKSANDLARGLYDILSAAFAAGDAMRLLNVATKASIAGLTTVSTSVDVFTSVLNSYGMTVSQATEVSDILFQTVVRGKLRFENLASAMGYITPIAANAGVAFKEIAAVLSTVTRMGLHVDMATRGLALGIQGIINPTEGAVKAAQKYDIEMSALSLRVKGLHGFITELNEATSKYGTRIIPELIGNMRSLRVFMALAGDEGVAGFTRDLDLLNKATGKTEEAMSKMAATSKMKVDILAQSMEELGRSIGEAWSETDIWLKKAQLWWGTLATGGDANRAVEAFDERVMQLKDAYLQLYEAQSKISGKTPLFEGLTAGGVDTTKFMEEQVDWEEIVEYLKLESSKIKLGEEMANALVSGEQLDLFKMRLDTGFYSYRDYAKKVSAETLADINRLLTDVGMETIEATPQYTVETLFTGKADIGKTYGQVIHELEKRITELNTTYADGTLELGIYEKQLLALQNSFDYLGGGLDSLSQSITSHKLNILDLENALDELEIQVKSTYTALGGEGFTGKLEWEYGVKSQETVLDRFKRFSGMAINYGMNMDTAFADGIEGYSWFNQETFNAIEGADKFSFSMLDVIETLQNYTEETNTAKDALETNRKAMELYTLESMRIELGGMMRRRGLSRSEERRLQRIKIEQMRLRINSMETTVAVEEKLEEEGYENAKRILDEYIANEEFALYLLKDIRNDELRDLDLLIEAKKESYEKYETWLAEEYTALRDEAQIYVDALGVIAASPELAEDYRELTGLNAVEEAWKAWEAYHAFMAGKELPDDYVKPWEEPPPPGDWGDDTLPPEEPSGDSGGYGGRAHPYWKYAKGIDYVPYDQMAMIHQGERIIPANENTGTSYGSSTVNITVNASVAKDYDVDRLAYQLGKAMQSNLMDNRTGKSKYRSR